MPRLWGQKEVYSLKLVNLHLWVATLGIVFYIAAMWVSGIMQGLMWRSYNELGFLDYSFVETVVAMHPFYVIRAIGGALYLSGALIMSYNFYRTIKGDVAAGEVDKDGNPRQARLAPRGPSWARTQTAN